MSWAIIRLFRPKAPGAILYSSWYPESRPELIVENSTWLGNMLGECTGLVGYWMLSSIFPSYCSAPGVVPGRMPDIVFVYLKIPSWPVTNGLCPGVCVTSANHSYYISKCLLPQNKQINWNGLVCLCVRLSVCVLRFLDFAVTIAHDHDLTLITDHRGVHP